MDLLCTRRIDPVRQSPRTWMYGYFTHGTDPPPRPCSSGFLSLPHRLRPPPSPAQLRRRFPGRTAFDRASDVGSEVARLRAGHRPPLKLYVQFSRIQLSRRLTLPGCNRRNQLNQVHQPVLAVQLGFRQLSPATVPPTLELMRPNAPHNPAVEPVEELSDVGSLVVLAPSPQDRLQFLNQLLGLKRHTSAG